MILVDSRIGSAELIPHIKKHGVPCIETMLDFGDVAIEGNGPRGKIMIGIERKTLADMLNCIESSRYAAHQRPGMMQTYDKSFLLIEGVWCSHSSDGSLMEAFRGGWQYYKRGYTKSRTMYSKLRRYLLSISLSGVIVIYTKDITQTAIDICEIYHYFSKNWENHTSLLELQKMAIPEVTGKPSLCRKWANDLTDIGTKFSLEAERVFSRSAIKLAHGTESDWLRIKGLGVQTARNVIKEIWEK